MACVVATCAERLGGVGAVSVCGPFCPGEKSGLPAGGGLYTLSVFAAMFGPT